MQTQVDISPENWLKEFVQSRDQRAFIKLTRHFYPMLYASAYRVCRHHSDAEDVVQQVFIVLARKAPQLLTVKSLGAWLHRAAVLESKKILDRNQRRLNRESEAMRRSTLEREAQDALQSLKPEIDASMDRLNEKDRSVLVMHYLEGRTFQSIASAIGGTAAAWQRRSLRAVEKLSQILGKRGVTAGSALLVTAMANMRAEGALIPPLPQEVIQQILVSEAASHTTQTLAGTLISMKLSVAICVLTGGLLSAAWERSRDKGPSSQAQHQLHASGSSGLASRKPRQRDTNAYFSLQEIAFWINAHDQSENPTGLDVARLSSLMFKVPDQHINDVLKLLESVENPRRFGAVVTALFGRWAEFSPPRALEGSRLCQLYQKHARRGVIVTWLDTDHVAATAMLPAKLTTEDRAIVMEYVRYESEKDAANAAVIVDHLLGKWPDWENRLRREVLSFWVKKDPVASLGWIKSFTNSRLKENVLDNYAHEVARIRGKEGMLFVDAIEDPNRREVVKNRAIYWWGISSGYRTFLEEVDERYDLRDGFPTDWSHKNIATFCRTMMTNSRQYAADLVGLARNQKERESVYIGLINGAIVSGPEGLQFAVEKVSEEYAASTSGKRSILAFADAWHKTSPEGLTDWVHSLPAGIKKAMLEQKLAELSVEP